MKSESTITMNHDESVYIKKILEFNKKISTDETKLVMLDSLLEKIKNGTVAK